MQSKMVCWGILGPGKIAREFLRGAQGSAIGAVTAIGTRDPGRPELAEHFPGLKVHAGYEALLADPGVEAVYIATPHPFHAEWAIAAARAGKHVLTEKPAAMNAAQVAAMFAAAATAGTFMGEAYMYRLHPLTALLLDLLRGGRIGELRLIKASFGFALPSFQPGHRLLSPDLGGGAILDVGGYPMSMARLLAGHACPEGFADPIDLVAIGRHGPTGVDEIASALVSFPDGVIAELSGSVGQWQDNVLHIMGTKGRLEVDAFWFGSGKYGGTARIRLIAPQAEPEVIELAEPRNLYSFQFEAANAAIRAGRTRFSHPAMSEADSLGNACALDRWLAQLHLAQPPLAMPRP